NAGDGDDLLVLPGNESDYDFSALNNNDGVYSGQILGPNNMSLTINNFDAIKYGDGYMGDSNLVYETTTTTTTEIDVEAMTASGATLETVVVSTNVEAEFTGGDQIWGGEGPMVGDWLNDFDESIAAADDGDQDVFFFAEGDGVDTIHDFEVGIDQLVISGYDRDDIDIYSVGNDTIIKLGDNGDALKLVDVDADSFGQASNISEYDADTDNSGSLSADELVDMKDDLFKGEGDAARGANDADVVLVDSVDVNLNIETSEEPPAS
ncbi:MAG: hypothetical protein R3261_05655, partial [Alphaproteobacteria bacterium]|nr:hypothetical protein [Alphaproteobacteria bacterium]